MKIRLFLDTGLVSGAKVALCAEDYNYLINVLRAKNGDEIFVFNGSDGEFPASLEITGKRQAFLILGQKVAGAEPLPDVWLLCPLLKKDTIDMAVQKATELGVGTISLIQTERTNAARVNEQRLRSIAKEAAEQCRRINVPEIKSVCKLGDVLNEWDSERTLFFLDETGKGNPIAQVFSEYKNKSSKVAFLVGPEGGFSDAEIKKLYALPFAEGVFLDKHILKAETAVCVALAMWKYI